MASGLILSSDSHVFEPPDLWTTRIDRVFRDRAPRIERVDGVDQLVVEEHQFVSGIGLISNAGARFEAPETISSHGRFEDVHRGGYDPDQHLEDMRLDGVAGEVLYPSQGLFYFKVADPLLMSAIFRAYNDWLAEFCSTDRARLKGIAMINLDDVRDGVEELERAARMGFAGAMITEYPLEDRRYDQPEYEPFWAAAEALAMPLSLHTATRRLGKIRGAGAKTLRDASSRATKAFYPATSMCDMIFSGVFERHPALALAVVEFELAWAPHLLSTMDYTYRERHEEALYRFKDGMRPSDFFHRNVCLGFQEDAIGIRLRDTIGVDNMMWGSDYPHSESTFPQSRKILAEILAGVPDDEQAKIVGGNTARLYGFDVARLSCSGAGKTLEVGVRADAAIPVIDLGPCLAGTPGALQSAAAALRGALERVGFFILVNHGVAQRLIDQTFAEARRFHDQPMDAKLAVRMNEHNNGYMVMGRYAVWTSEVNDNDKPDLNEAFFCKRERPPDDPLLRSGRRFVGPNRWPQALPGFRERVLAYTDAMDALSRRVLPVCAVALGLPPEAFDRAFAESQFSFRLTHYPPVRAEANQFGIAPHTDANFLTFLAQTEVPGLQVRMPSGEWADVPFIPGSYAVNSGDMMHRWTNGRVKSTPHRALPPVGRPRYAIPFFLGPHIDTLIECLPTCQGPDDPPRLPPITYGDYLTWWYDANYNASLQDDAAPARGE